MTAPALRLDAVKSADIRGRKTRLRPMRRDEAPLFYEWVTDAEVQPFWGGRDHYKDLDDFLQHWPALYFDGSQPDRGRCFAIETEGRPIGMIAYSHVDVDNGSTEIDIIIGDPNYRDRGYGTDAIRAFLGFLFDAMRFHRVWLGTYEHNARARRAYEKCGFVREGAMRKSDWVDGRWVDAVIYGILEDEFREGRSQRRSS